MSSVTTRDVLAHLTFTRAAKILGPDGKRLLSSGNGYSGTQVFTICNYEQTLRDRR